jgi:hypothetical protein
LELQRHAMFMFTSCGWFFDDISGLESTQILMYAGRVLQLAEEALGLSLEQGLLEYLEQAPSNVAAFGTGAEVFRQRVASARLDLLRVGAHYAISCLFEPEQGRDQVYCYLVSCQGLRRREAGSLKQVAGQARLVSQVTGQQAEFSFAALHLGEHNVVAGLRQGLAPSEFAAVLDGLEEAFARSDVPELVRQMDAHFPNRYTLWHLFKDSQQRVLNEIMQGTLEDLTVNFRQIVDANHSLINFLCTMSRPLPRPLAVAAEFVINQDLRLLLEQPEPDLQRLEEVVEQSRRWKVPVQGQELRYRASWSLGRLFESLGAKPGSRGLLEEIEGLIQLFDQLGLKVDLWKAQNVYFDLTQSQLKPMRRDQAQGDQEAGAWIQVFERVGELLGVCPE